MNNSTFDPREFRGCSSKDLDELAAVTGSPIPLAVKTHLLVAGRRMAWFRPYSQFFFPALLEANEYLHAKWRKSSSFPGEDFTEELPADALVVAGNGGYEWWWVRSSEGDDPMVYYYEQDGDFTEFVPLKKYSEWIASIKEIMEEDFAKYKRVILKSGAENFKHAIGRVYDVLEFLVGIDPTQQPFWTMVKQNYERLSSYLYEAALGKEAVSPIRSYELDASARVDHLLPKLEPHPGLAPNILNDMAEKTRAAIAACGFR